MQVWEAFPELVGQDQLVEQEVQDHLQDLEQQPLEEKPLPLPLLKPQVIQRLSLESEHLNTEVNKMCPDQERNVLHGLIV